tara:strand:- start:271 stop:579 length:309 start_codon:yes stop_codon:yes gene_type:complete
MSYNGWTNWETWNVAMWIGNDEMFHRMMTLTAKGDWEKFKALAMQFGITKTPDGVSFEDELVDQDQLRKTHMIDQEEIEEEEEEECPVLEGRRLQKLRSYYI